MEVYNQLGQGFLEAVYQEALEKEFIFRGNPYVREKDLFIRYKGDLSSCHRIKSGASVKFWLF